MSDKYPMISELGLEVIGAGMSNYAAVKADDLESLLAKSVRVTRQDLPLADCWKWGEHNSQNRPETHTALLLNIKPIQKLEAVSIQKIDSILASTQPTLMQALSLLHDIKERGIK